MSEAESIIKTVVLSSLNREHSNKPINKVIAAYEKKYGKRISNWNKLKSDVNHVMRSNISDKQRLGTQVILLALKNGLNYIYVGQDDVSKRFRAVLLKQKQKKFMERVYSTFN